MRHPLEWIPLKTRKPLFFLFLAWSLVLLILFQFLNRPLMTPPAPSGIISLQLAWTPGKAATMLGSWDGTARQYAAFGLGFDYLFMCVYALALALGALVAAGRHPGWFARLGAWAAYGAFLAAICDGLENYCQVAELFHGRVDLAPLVGIFATVKFALLLIGLVFGLVGWIWPKTK